MDGECWKLYYKCYHDVEKGINEVESLAKEQGYEKIGPWKELSGAIVSLNYFVKGEYFLHLVRYQDILCVYGFVDFDFQNPFAVVRSCSRAGLERCRSRIEKLSFISNELKGSGKKFHELAGIELSVECPEREDVENSYYVQLVQFIGSLYILFWANRNIHLDSRKIIELDRRIQSSYNYRLPENVDEEFLQRLSRDMEEAGYIVMRMEHYHGLIEFHIKNLKMMMERLCIEIPEGKNFGMWDIETKPLLEAEHRLRVAKTVWNRLKMLRDLANSMISIRMQKSSHSLHFASWIMEFFVIFVYSLELWELMNPNGYEAASGVLKGLVPPLIAFGIVLLTEGIIRRESRDRKAYVLISVGIIFVLLGILVIGLYPSQR